MAEEIIDKLEALDKGLKIIAEHYRVHYESFRYPVRDCNNRISLRIMLNNNGWNRDIVADGSTASADIISEFLEACSDLREAKPKPRICDTCRKELVAKELNNIVYKTATSDSDNIRPYPVLCDDCYKKVVWSKA